ncbi:MAG: DUF5719 family protein [Varibaculum sp.]|nr:DUF5719 family protein [Varibaculum sp.]
MSEQSPNRRFSGVVKVAGALISAVLLLVGAGGAVVAVALAPTAEPSAAATFTGIAPASDTLRYCPPLSGKSTGSLVAIVTGTADNPGFGSGTLQDREISQVRTLASAAGGVLTGKPAAGKRTQPVGATRAFVATDTASGLLAGTCMASAQETWLVGGSTVVGRSTRLYLQNIAESSTSVRLEAYGSTGRVNLTNANWTLKPGENTTVPLEAKIPDEERLAVRVVADGPGVVAWMVSDGTEKVHTIGADLIGPAAGAAKQVVVPGIQFGFDDSAVRIVNPSNRGVKASVRVSTDTSEPLVGAENIEIPAGSVFDVSLSGLSEGIGSLTVSANRPILASAVTLGADMAWAQSVSPSADGVLVLPVDGVAAFYASAATSVNVDTETVDIAVGETKTVKLKAGVYPWSAGDVRVAAAAVITGEKAGGLIGGLQDNQVANRHLSANAALSRAVLPSLPSADQAATRRVSVR